MPNLPYLLRDKFWHFSPDGNEKVTMSKDIAIVKKAAQCRDDIQVVLHVSAILQNAIIQNSLLYIHTA